MDDFKPKNREWVKNAAIVFLAVLLVLTFFSNTIRNRTLPEVATMYVESGPITAKVRGSGTVVANGSHQVKAEQTREIRAVMVKVGQEVSAGDVLFVLGAGDSLELEQAQEALRSLQTSYQKAALSIPTYDYTLDEQKIKRAKEDLDAANKTFEAAKKELEKYSQASPEEIKAAEDARNAAKTTYDEVEEKFYQAKLEAQENYLDAQTNLDKLLGPGGGSVPGLDKASTPDKNIIKLVTETVEAAPASADFPEDSAQGGEAGESGANNGSGTETPPPAKPEVITVYKLIGMTRDMRWQINDGASEGVWMDVVGDGDVILHGFTPTNTSKIRIVRKGDGIKTGASDFLVISFNNAENKPAYSVEAAPVALPNESAEVTAARKVLADAKIKLEAAESDYEYNVGIAKSNLDICQTRLDNLLATGGPAKEAYDAASKELAAAEDNLLTLEKELELRKLADSKNSQLAYIDLSDLATQMELQKKKIKELSGGEENTVTANVSGTVQSVDCTSGDTKMKDDLLCTIEVPDMGYTMSFSVTNEQARRLHPGDTATVSNYYWGNEIKATLSSIKTDPKKPQSNKILAFDLEGDVNTGTELTLSVGQKSANYDVVIPNSAIRTDTNGSFVLKIEAKNSPLGNRYIARRVSVEVIVADDVNSAVSGDLGYGDYVITTSSAPVKSGDLVRMADS